MQIRAHLFGKFQLEAISSSGVSAVVPLEPGKVRDLLCFLLLYPERAHHRRPEIHVARSLRRRAQIRSGRA